MTEKSGNLRNNLNDIIKAVSSLRKEFAKLMSEVDDKSKLIVELEMKDVETITTVWHGKQLQRGPGSNIPWFASELQGQRMEHALSTGRTRMRYSQFVADSRVMCLMIIKCTNCLLNLKIITVQNTPRPYLRQK